MNHGGSESVEVFEVDLNGPRPTLRWRGGVGLPGSTVGNGRRGYRRSTGVVVYPRLGAAAGHADQYGDGVAVSRDGEWVYIGGWNSRCIKKVRRGSADDPETATVGLDIMVDNITWSASGRLLAAGTYGISMQDFLAGHLARTRDSHSRRE